MRTRRAFTLIELLTAMAIVTLLAAISVPILVNIIQGDKIRDASSSIQAAITAARERAALDNRATGIRLISDPANPELVRQIIFIREADPIAPGGSSLGGAIVSDAVSRVLGRPLTNDTVEIPVDPRFVSNVLSQLPRERVILMRYSPPLPQNFNQAAIVARGYLRLNGTGPYRPFSYFFNGELSNSFNPSSINWGGLPTVNEVRTVLVLDTPLHNQVGETRFPITSSGNRIEIARPPVPLEGAEPLNLPTGIVIDLGQLPKVVQQSSVYVCETNVDDSALRLSRITPRLRYGNVDQATQAVDFNFDIMFGPERNVIGSGSVDDRVILWVRDENAVTAEGNTDVNTRMVTQPAFNIVRKEIRSESPASSSLVVLATRTGQIGTYKPVLVDENGDGFADWNQYYRNVEEGVGVNE